MLHPSAHLFAFHNEFGMVQFVREPKGRCRCYDNSPCKLVPDGGYTLWSTIERCPPEVPPWLRGEKEPAHEAQQGEGAVMYTGSIADEEVPQPLVDSLLMPHRKERNGSDATTNSSQR